MVSAFTVVYFSIQDFTSLLLVFLHTCTGIETNLSLILRLEHLSQCIFDFEIRKKQMFTEARAFSRVTYFLFSGEPAGFFLKLT